MTFHHHDDHDMHDPMRTALIAEEVLSTLTMADVKELLTIAPHAFPPGVWDQMTAAAQDTSAIVDGHYAKHGTTGRVATVPGWARLLVLEAHAQYMDDRAPRTCAHHPHGLFPQPVFAAAWKPGLIVCSLCQKMLELDDPIEDKRCDGCGRVVAGPEHGDGIHAQAFQYGTLVYRWGSCDGCIDEAPEEFQPKGLHPRAKVKKNTRRKVNRRKGKKR